MLIAGKQVRAYAPACSSTLRHSATWARCCGVEFSGHLIVNDLSLPPLCQLSTAYYEQRVFVSLIYFLFLHKHAIVYFM